jgi:hypothetical protein
VSTTSAAAISTGRRNAGWSITQLWVAATGIGGGFSRADVDRISQDQQDATPIEHDILASALNDHFTDLGQDHPVPYWDQLHATGTDVVSG